MLVLVALVGWVVYVTVLGDSEDKAKRDKLLGTAKDFGQSIVEVFQHEQEKVKEGTYDELLASLDKAIDNLKEADAKGDYKKRLQDLQTEKERIEDLINQNKGARMAEDPNIQNNEDLKKLAENVVKLTEDMEKNKK